MNWTAIESVGTACSAVFTAVMAGMTWRAIADGRKHHKDEYRPILVLAPQEGVAASRREEFLKPEGPPSSSAAVYSLAGVVLKNIGAGPALNCRLAIRFHGIEDYGVTRDLAPVQAGGEYGGGERPLRIPVSFDRVFNDIDFRIGPGSGWDILLEFQDLFGQVFHTVHTSDSRAPWTVIGAGPMPKGESSQRRARRLIQGSAETTGNLLEETT